MRIAVIGAGIAGVTSAYELAADGHSVTVFERRGSVAAESSFANAGLVAPGLALPWQQPRFPRPFGNAPLAWQWQGWRAGRAPNAAVRAQVLQLALLSRERLLALRRSLALDFECAEGVLLLLRGERDAAAVQASLDEIATLGINHRMLEPALCRVAEPGLNPDTALHGGVLLMQAEVANCRQFAHQLRLEAQRAGVQFRFHTTVRRIEPGATVQLSHEHTPDVDGEGTSAGPQHDSFDAVVICAALGSAALLRPLGLKLPMHASPGLSITAPLRILEAHPDLGPKAGLVDVQRKVTIARIGQRVRVSGSSDVSEAELHAVLNDWFPGAMVAGQVQRWAGTHAVLADGLPLIGASGKPGIWLNTAHGDSGWTLACGAARAIAEQIAGPLAGFLPEADISGLDMRRLG